MAKPSRNNPPTDRFLRDPELRQITGLSTTTIWRLEKRGDFPTRVRISPGAVAWVESQVQTWMEERQQRQAQQEISQGVA